MSCALEYAEWIALRRVGWAGYEALTGKVRNVYEGLRELWREGVDWIHLAQDRDQ
jgi:hypothetical protein